MDIDKEQKKKVSKLPKKAPKKESKVAKVLEEQKQEEEVKQVKQKQKKGEKKKSKSKDVEKKEEQKKMKKENKKQQGEDEEEKKKQPRKVKEQKVSALQRAVSTREERAKRRMDKMEEDDNEEQKNEVHQINTDVQKPKKREIKEKQKAIAKKKEPQQIREEVEIPDVVLAKEDTDDNLQLGCCQTCSNRNCMRAVVTNQVSLFEKCIESKAYVTSLLEHLSPELKVNALEQAIALNRHDIIEMIFAQVKSETETRAKKREAQIAKFDTGEVGKMAFGIKVRKVNIMRGNRQGNNAFLEDSSHEHTTPMDYLLKNEFCIAKAFPNDSVTHETIQVLHKVLPKQSFDQFTELVVPVLLKHGCVHALNALFKIQGTNKDPTKSVFNQVFMELLLLEDVITFTLKKEDLVAANKNEIYKPAHFAALNPSGAGLKFLLQHKEEINVKVEKRSTVHYAAVCSTSQNLQIMFENEIELHELDDHKQTPLHWAIQSKAHSANIRFIMDNLNLKTQKDAADDQKKMAIHYVCQFGCAKDETNEVIDLMMENRAKFSQAGGWDKYTPLGYAATYGQEEVVKYLLENVPKLNINKGDKYQRTPLLMACRNGHARVAALLIKHNADLNKPDSSGNTPLHNAAAYGWLECVNLLMKYGADLSPENAWKTTPAIIALQKNHLAIVMELLRAKEDINANTKDDEGRTMLTLTMANIHFETPDFVSLLISEKQADPNLQDAKGRTPLYHLVHNMTQKKRGLFDDEDEIEYKIVKILIASGASVNLKSKDGKSPFTLAFEHGLTRLLDIFGCSVDLNEDPSLFFAISGVNILKIKTHQLLSSCMRTRLEDEAINFVNEQGFTPFLFYINEFCKVRTDILSTIQTQLNKKQKIIDNSTIVTECLEINGRVQQGAGAEGLKIFIKEITEPFISFLKVLLQNGANPNAYVLKLKQFREESIHSTSQLSQVSQLTQAALKTIARAEKDQYISEALGLSSAVHILLNTEGQQKELTELFDYLLTIEGIELNQVNFQKMTPFFKLVKTKDIKADGFSKHCFETLIQSGKIDINAPDQFGSTAFWFLYTNKRYVEAMFLVDHGGNINHMDNYGEFALKREMYAGDLNLLTILLEKGADPNQKDEFGRTVLHLACNQAHRKDMKEIIKVLVQYKAELDNRDFKQRTPIHYLFVQKNRRFERGEFDPLNNGLQLLVNADRKVDINIQDANGKSVIHYAAQRGSLHSLEYLVKVIGLEGIQFDLVDRYLNTPLSVAINCKHFKFVEKLLEYGIVDMKGFIYEEPIKNNNGQNNNNNLMMNQFGNQFGNNNLGGDNNEQSDFEYMEVQQLQQINDNTNRKHNKEEAVNVFRYALKNNIAELEKLFIKHNYDKIQMIIDYICEGQINKLFEVIEKYFKSQAGAKGSILIQKNQKEQNLIHVLARNSHRIKEIGEITKFYKQLVEEGVDAHHLDYKGRSVLQLAVLSGNLHFIKFLVEVEKFNVKDSDNSGNNLISCLIRGDRILSANSKILEYLIANGCDPNCLYQEKMHEDQNQKEEQNKYKIEDQEEEKESHNIMQIRIESKNSDRKENHKKEQQQLYRTTAVIHAIRHEAKERTHIQEILKILLKHSNLSILDSRGRDAFMYIAMKNHLRTFNFIIQSLKEKNQEDSIAKNNVDTANGKTFIHYIINPLPFGSYENKELLKMALDFGFEYNIKDKQGKTPFDYAAIQKSGIMKTILEDFDAGKHKLKGVEKQREEEEDKQMQIDDLILLKLLKEQEKFPLVDFEKDAHEYLYSIQMQIDPQHSVPCDPSGKFNDDCEVLFDDNTNQHFDAYLTRVELGRFQPGGDYLFYRMQLVWDRARDLSILLTRWGRIGEEGAFQKTPFNKKQEAVDEFRKVFEQKTNNKWMPKDKFQKKFRKFQVMRTNYITLDQKNFLVPFTNLEQPLKYTNQEVIEVLREICDVNTYLKALQNSGVDPKAMPFSNLHRKNLYDALEVLEKLEKTLDKLEGLNPRPYAENEKNTLLSLREKMWSLSGRFYEQIPHEEFRNKMVPPISTQAMLSQKSQLLQNLVDIEMASKMLLGAHGRQEEMHPLEYCMLASGVNFTNLDYQDSEFKLIQEYVNNTNMEKKEKKVMRILKLNKESDNLKFKSDIQNRMLLFHGSRISNFLSILSQGLKIQPIQVKRQGDQLGKGIYFTDVISKALQYTNDQNAPHSSKFVLVCEVALGESKQLNRISNNYKFEEGFNSVQGLGRQGPEKKKFITLKDGVKVPYGKCQVLNNVADSDFQYNEYMVADSNQVRFRYLIQMK